MTKTKHSKTKSSLKSENHQGPFRVAACWPHQDAPLIMTMLGQGKVAIATSFTPIAFDSLRPLRIGELADQTCETPMAADLPRWVFAIPYETFTENEQSAHSERTMAWAIKAALIWDDGKTEPRYLAASDAQSARFHLDLSRDLKPLLADAQKWSPIEAEAIQILPSTSDDSYLENVQSIIASIRNGEFYQVNLLRYFQAHKAGGWENLCMRMEKLSGPFGCIITQGSRVIASFSPERFVEISREDQKIIIDTWPIKGTAARNRESETADRMSGESLAASEKDQAELRMIIDLMRNDLTKICEPCSVNVLSPGDLKKFPNVWHLEGHISGILRDQVTLNELLISLCPGGSITGAPKIAAMQRIRADEGQERGFFMGNLFTIMHDGSIKSNILIRTMTSDNFARTARYAAGSGIVIKSTPEKELLEISSKCAVLTGPNQ